MALQPRPLYGAPGAGHHGRQAGWLGMNTGGLMAPPARTRRCSSRSTVSSGATPSSSLVDISRRSTAASATPAPAANVAYIPPATGPARASRTPMSTSTEAHALLSMLALRGTTGAGWCCESHYEHRAELINWKVGIGRSISFHAWAQFDTCVSTLILVSASSFTTSSFCVK